MSGHALGRRRGRRWPGLIAIAALAIGCGTATHITTITTTTTTVTATSSSTLAPQMSGSTSASTAAQSQTSPASCPDGQVWDAQANGCITIGGASQTTTTASPTQPPTRVSSSAFRPHRTSVRRPASAALRDRSHEKRQSATRVVLGQAERARFHRRPTGTRNVQATRFQGSRSTPTGCRASSSLTFSRTSSGARPAGRKTRHSGPGKGRPKWCAESDQSRPDRWRLSSRSPLRDAVVVRPKQLQPSCQRPRPRPRPLSRLRRRQAARVVDVRATGTRVSATGKRSRRKAGWSSSATTAAGTMQVGCPAHALIMAANQLARARLLVPTRLRLLRPALSRSPATARPLQAPMWSRITRMVRADPRSPTTNRSRAPMSTGVPRAAIRACSQAQGQMRRSSSARHRRRPPALRLAPISRKAATASTRNRINNSARRLVAPGRPESRRLASRAIAPTFPTTSSGRAAEMRKLPLVGLSLALAGGLRLIRRR
jgi:hypothetical protein